MIRRRFFRDSCINRGRSVGVLFQSLLLDGRVHTGHGHFVKDLSVVSADLSKVLIIDNSPDAYSMNTTNAVPIEAWYSNPHDQVQQCMSMARAVVTIQPQELLRLIPFLESACCLQDVRNLLQLRLMR